MKCRACTVGIVVLVSFSTVALFGMGAGRSSVQPEVERGIQPDAQPGSGDARPPAVQWVGPYSNIATPGFYRATDREAWTTLWASHRGDLADYSPRGRIMPPEIDFGRYMVVARFTGESAHNNGESASSVFRRGDTVVLRFDSRTYQTMMPDPDDEPAAKSLPYGIWVVERFEGPVIVEEDHNNRLGNDPVWKEVHRFEALVPSGVD